MKIYDENGNENDLPVVSSTEPSDWGTNGGWPNCFPPDSVPKGTPDIDDPIEQEQ